MDRLNDLRYQIGDLLQEKPWIKWAGLLIVGLALLILVMQFLRPTTDPGLSGDRLATQVQVRFDDTGDTIKVPIGFITSDLLKLETPLGESSKVTNPKSGKRTGTIVDQSEWNRILRDVTRLKSP